jgi:hypothetical protein
MPPTHVYEVHRRKATETEFQFLKRVIAKHGERVKWRHRRDVVLFDGFFAYCDAGASSIAATKIPYLNGGRPSEKVLKRLRKRFWPMTADRRYYNYIAKF